MSLTKWAVGIIVFDLLVVLLLISMGTRIATEYNNELVQNPEYSSSDSIDISTLGFFDKISWSITGLPWYISTIMLIPNIILAIVLVGYLRGVN